MRKFVFTVVLALALSACGANAQPANQVAVVVNEFSYTPNVITVKAGEPVELTLTNEGAIEHDFVIEQIDVEDVSTTGSGMGSHHMGGEDHANYDLHISTSAGGTSVLKFTPSTPGRYKIICSVQGHYEAGMIGELVVVE